MFLLTHFSAVPFICMQSLGPQGFMVLELRTGRTDGRKDRLTHTDIFWYGYTLLMVSSCPACDVFTKLLHESKMQYVNDTAFTFFMLRSPCFTGRRIVAALVWQCCPWSYPSCHLPGSHWISMPTRMPSCLLETSWLVHTHIPRIHATKSIL